MRLRKVIFFLSGTLLLVIVFGLTITFISLNNTSWQLDYLVIDANRQKSYFVGTPTISFEGLSVKGSDGCNNFTMRYFPSIFGYIDLRTKSKALRGCGIVNESTGLRIGTSLYEDQLMEALQKANRVEIREQTMRVYFGSDDTDMIVFSRLP